MKPLVVVDPLFRRMEDLFGPEDLAALGAVAEVAWGRNGDMPADELARCRDRAEAIVCGYWKHGSPNDYPKLRVIIEVGGTHPSPKSLDYGACFARGIQVLSCAPGFGPAVAEMALALTLACTRTVVETDRRFRDGSERWLFDETSDSFTLHDQPVGFIGFGGLARNLRPLLAPFRCPVRVYDPWLADEFLKEQGVEPADLDSVLSGSRVIYVLAIPTPENRGLLDRRRLELIRPGSVLILISRAHLVDFGALTECVLAGRFRAGVDVFPEEPLPRDHAIRKAPLAVLSSHKAGAMREAMRLIGRWTVRDLEAVLRGLPPQYLQPAGLEIVRRMAC
jgi:phosphoglycerate dehydrogenase-like enzyme